MMQEFDEDFFFEEDKILVDAECKNEDKRAPIVEVDETSLKDPYTDDSVCLLNDLREERYNINHQDLMGMTVTSGSVVLNKDDKNLIGISIGGGAPLCPCLYIVQVFDNSPAYKEGTLESGDEIVGVNGQPVKGKSKQEVAKIIQGAKEQVTINYNKLHADPRQGKSLDIVMKKLKHRLVDNMSSQTADALGLSRAILCNDTLLAKLDELNSTEQMYRKLLEIATNMLKRHFDLLLTYKAMGDTFTSIAVREPQSRASEAFGKFGNYHRQLEKEGIKMLKTVKPLLADMKTYLVKAIPDTKLTIKKYADTKFEYLSYCLKVKEMDDEEVSFNSLQEPLYRVETGNYEYRLILRCRQDARTRFAKLREDVLVKLELLLSKRTTDLVSQLSDFIKGLAGYHLETSELIDRHRGLFPVEVDLSQNAFQYKSTLPLYQDNQDETEYTDEVREYHDHVPSNTERIDPPKEAKITEGTLLPGLTSDASNFDSSVDNLTLLTELGLTDDSVNQQRSSGGGDEFGEFQAGGLIDDFLPNQNSATDSIFDKLFEDISLN